MNKIEIAYKALVKITLMSICLLVLVYMSAGPVSQIVFECVQDPVADSIKGIASAQQLCEVYRPFFLLEFVVGEHVTKVLLYLAALVIGVLGCSVLLRKSALFELSLVGVSFLIAFSTYRYLGNRTLVLSDFAKQKTQGVLQSVEFKAKCPWKGVECFGR